MAMNPAYTRQFPWSTGSRDPSHTRGVIGPIVAPEVEGELRCPSSEIESKNAPAIKRGNISSCDYSSGGYMTGRELGVPLTPSGPLN
jgi:hypothetical protein